MRIYVLTVDNNHDLRRVLKILDKHGILYYVVILANIPNSKANVLGGIISQYNIQMVKLEQILFILARHGSYKAS